MDFFHLKCVDLYGQVVIQKHIANLWAGGPRVGDPRVGSLMTGGAGWVAPGGQDRWPQGG